MKEDRGTDISKSELQRRGNNDTSFNFPFLPFFQPRVDDLPTLYLLNSYVTEDEKKKIDHLRKDKKYSSSNNEHSEHSLTEEIRKLRHFQQEDHSEADQGNDDDTKNKKTPHSASQQLSKTGTQVVSASSAGIRAILYQITSLYLRTPAKLFRPSRFDYLTTARALLHPDIAAKPWNFFSHSSIALLVNAVKTKGWQFIPKQVLPPIIMNSATGVVLYTTYLTSLQYFNGFKMKSLEDPHPFDTFRAGFLAGAAQSLVAAPIDALYARSTYSEIVSGKHEDLWRYGLQKLKQIGIFGVFAGYTASFFKESLGFAFYFSIFEMVKNQGYHRTQDLIDSFQYYKAKILFREVPAHVEHPKSVTALQLTFVLFAGASAATALLAIQYPLNRIQKIHLSRLEALDMYNEAMFNEKRRFFKLYYNSYIQTYDQVVHMKNRSNMTWLQFAYRGFFRNAFTTIPATSIGLLVFEITRQKLSYDLGEYAQTLDS